MLSLWWQPRPWLDDDYRPESEFRLYGSDELPQSLQRWVDAEGWVVAPPSGWNRAAWLARLMFEARTAAESEDWAFDLDPWVQRRIDALQRRLGPVEPGQIDDVWQKLLQGFGFKLHRYQIHGARFLAKMGRAFLADDMGLGKTVQAIAATEILSRTGDVRRALIVCPASLKHQWRCEIEKACGAQAQVVEGRPNQRERLYEEWNSGYLIVNYELLLRDLAQLQRCAPDLIVLDEAQRIKNWGTQTARAVKRMRSRYAFVLTGTPLENRLLELHSIVEYLQPRALGPRWRLLPFHAVTADEGRIIAYEGLSHLRDRLRPFFVRRERNQVLDQLPDRTENTFWTQLTAQQKRPYRRCAVQLGQLLSAGNQLQPHQVRLLLQLLTRMRIICNSAVQHDWDEFAPRLAQPEPPSATEIKLLGSPKLEEFAHLVEELLEQGTAKMVVFSQWERTLRLAEFVLREPMRRLGLSSGLFHGGLSGRARGAMIERFNQDPNFRVLLSTDAGGVGLNLQVASIVMNLEVPWNPAVLQQRIARVHRMGQLNSVQVLHFVTQDAIEERVRQVVENKQSLFTGLLTEGIDTVRFSEEGRAGTLIEKVRLLIEDQDS